MVEHINEDEITKLRGVETDDYGLPDFGSKPHKSGTDLFNRPYQWYQEEEVGSAEVEEEVQPLTIEDIESIRQAAYEEGLTEGRKHGFEQGIIEGKEQGREQGHSEGLQQGIQEGLEQGQSQIDTLSSYWQALLEEMIEPVQQITAQVQMQMVDVICEVARGIIRCELETNQQVIIHTVKEAIQAMPMNAQQLLIHLNPEDLMVIEGVFPKETQEKKNWQLLVDGSLARGDCAIEAENSTIERSMEEVVAQALKSFKSDNLDNLRQVEPREVPQFTPMAQSMDNVDGDANQVNEQPTDELGESTDSKMDEHESPTESASSARDHEGPTHARDTENPSLGSDDESESNT